MLQRMKIFDLDSALGSLALGLNLHADHEPINHKPYFLIEPLSWFCIDSPSVGDTMFYTNIHPRVFNSS